MELNTDVDVINYYFDNGNVEQIAQEDLNKKRDVIYLVYHRAWREAEEYHRECQKKGITPEQDAINRNLRLS